MYIVGYPRSGNTWLCYLLAYSLNAEYDDRDDPGVHPRSESQRRYVKGGLVHPSYQAQVGRVLKTHALHLDYDGNEPLVYLVRDGRDVMVSYYFYKQAFARQAASQARVRGVARRLLRKIGLHSSDRTSSTLSLSEFVGEYSSDWAHHVRTWLARNPTAIVRYEDLHTAPVQTLSNLLTALEVQVPPVIVQQAVELFSFERLSGRRSGKENSKAFFRKGTVGDWQNHFSERDREYFSRVAGDLLSELGYTELEGEHGSFHGEASN